MICSRPCWFAILLLSGMLVADAQQPDPDGVTAPEVRPALLERHQRFLEEVSLLVSEPERRAFLELTQPHQRDRFIQRFWQARDPFPQTARNEFRDRWEANAELARARFVDLSDPRAQVILFFGEESRTLRSTCSELLTPIEIWFFDGVETGSGQFTVVFLRQGDNVRLWSPHQGLTRLRSPFFITRSDEEHLRRVAEDCPRGDEILLAIQQTADWEQLRDRLSLKPARAEDWVAAFLASSTDVPEGAAELPASHHTSFPGVHQSRTVVQLLLTVPREHAVLAETGPYESYNFLVDGEVLRRGELFETFRYKFNVPAEEGAEPGDQIPLALERNLRAGDYTWIIRLQDLNGNSYYQLREDVAVPNVLVADGGGRDHEPLGEAPEPEGRLEFLAEANASLEDAADGDQVVKLWAPRDRLLTGTVRVEARATGERISRVAFDLDGKQVMAKTSPPYSIEINLGRAPRLHTLQARALDASGRTVARDQVLLNAGPHHFAVRLIEPQRGGRYTRSVRARAEPEVPEGEALERVELYLNETLVATLYQPPFVQPIAIPPAQELAYVRAVAYLGDGNSTEDLVFVNSPHPLDEVRVDLVELYTSVFDSKGRPVDGGLATADFLVKEDGIEQSIRRFEHVAERPIHAGILLDNSTSMLNSLREAEKAALQFFQSVVRPRDRACLITFNDSPQLVVPFTNDHEILAGGLAGLVSEGETALHDSIVYALHYFSGLRGKRALVLISDGEDVGSAYTFDDALDFARRTGVPIYTIGLGLAQRDAMARTKLMRLAQDTGARSFFIDKADGLTSVYQRIETELRAQFLIAYQSSQGNEGSDRYRQVDLQIKKPGLSAKTMRGYYP
ncbi:MAG TPA: VWA domain-containing protein [Thermoanaerobaculia bacterium]|nr:VWA domain-containing protein [Thermoanaerobaculia bacterium]